MLKKLLGGIFWILLANLIVKPLWLLGIEVSVQNTVGNEAYGFYYALFSFSYIFNILLDLGLTNFNTRNMAQHPQLISKHLSGILGIKICLLGVYVAVTFAAGFIMGYGCAEFRLLALLTICQFLNSLILYLRSNLEGLMLFKWDSLFSVLDRILMIIICGMLLWGPRLSILNIDFTIYHFVFAQLAAYLITAALAIMVISRKTHFRRLRFDWRFFLVILRQSAPFALLVLLMASYNRIDPILLRLIASDADAGIYAGAFRLLDALTMFAYLISVPLLPTYSRLSHDGNNKHIADITRIVFWPVLILSLAVAIICSLYAEQLMGFLYHSQAQLYAPIFRTIIFSLVPISITYIFGTLLTAGGHMRQLNIFAVTSLALNITINIILIPRIGAVGSAWASLSAQSFMAIAQLILAIKLFHLPASTFRIPSMTTIKALLKEQTTQ